MFNLKTALRKKFGDNSYVVEAVEHLEKKPEAKTRQAGVVEKIKAAKVNEDEELITVAETLLAELKKTPTGQQVSAKSIIGAVGENIHAGRDIIGALYQEYIDRSYAVGFATR